MHSAGRRQGRGLVQESSCVTQARDGKRGRPAGPRDTDHVSSFDTGPDRGRGGWSIGVSAKLLAEKPLLVRLEEFEAYQELAAKVGQVHVVLGDGALPQLQLQLKS